MNAALIEENESKSVDENDVLSRRNGGSKGREKNRDQITGAEAVKGEREGEETEKKEGRTQKST